MKLTEEFVKTIIKQVHVDLNLDVDDRYPINCRYVEEWDSLKEIKNYWIGSYDYSDPEAAGDEWIANYSKFITIIDDKTGEAIRYSHYTGHYKIKLNKDKNVYEIVERLFRK